MPSSTSLPSPAPALRTAGKSGVFKRFAPLIGGTFRAAPIHGVRMTTPSIPGAADQDNMPFTEGADGQNARDPDSRHSGLADDDTPLHVLVADDESVIVDEIVEFFTDEGMAVTTAADGAAAAALFAAAPPGQFTVVLTDLRMPGQDGYALARGINAATSRANAVEVMIMTGHGSYGSTFSNPNIEIFEFIKKPLNLERLADAVRRAHESAIERRRQQRARAFAAGELRGELARLDQLAVAHGNDATGAAAPLPALLALARMLGEDATLLPPERMRLYAAALRDAANGLGALPHPTQTDNSAGSKPPG